MSGIQTYTSYNMQTAKQNKKYFNRLIHFLIKSGIWFLGFIGFFSFLIFILSFTDIPFYAYYRLGTANSGLNHQPDIIVILSGSGMPSPDGLIRAYYGVEAARKFKEAKIVIALPYNEADSMRPLKLMAHEFIVEGIDSSRIQFEPIGFNTRSQALNIAAMYAADKQKLSLVLITSPEHMFRAVRTFIKVGFSEVGGMATFDIPIDTKKVMDIDKSKDIRVKSLSLRYNMWSYLHLELFVIREYCAICYYKLKGWI
ncbi:MAG: YdcF family protein [Bacteroidales bacterium]